MSLFVLEQAKKLRSLRNGVQRTAAEFRRHCQGYYLAMQPPVDRLFPFRSMMDETTEP